MVDYSNQKPVMNPSYVKKPSTASQRKAGGQGGQGAALASNVIAGNSGQAGQAESMFSPGKGLNYNPKAKPAFPDVGTPTNDLATNFNKGGIVGLIRQGATDVYNDVSKPASRIGSDFLSGASAIAFGKEAGNTTSASPISNVHQPVADTSASHLSNVSTPKSTTSATMLSNAGTNSSQKESISTKPALGQFTTPEGGFAKVSISPNQSINTDGKGLHQLTPDQQTYLQNTIDRNARPEVRAEFAKQAAIVDERRQKTAAWDAANSPNSPANLAAQSRGLFLNAMRTNNLGGIQEYGDLYKQESKNAVDYNQTNASLANGAMGNAVEQAKLGQLANSKGIDQSIEAQKHNDTTIQKLYDWGTDLAKGGSASAPQRFGAALAVGHVPDESFVFGDKTAELQAIKDPVERQNWLIEQLGPEYAKQWSDLHKTQ